MRLSIRTLAAAILVAAATAGCGSSSAPASNKAQIQDTTKTFVNALLGGDNATACSVTTAPDKCLGDLTLASAYLGKNGSWQTVFGDDWQSELAKAPITVHGNSATMASWGKGNSDSSPDDFKKVNGKWLLVMTDDSSSSSSGGDASSYPTAAQANEWPQKWCQVKLGMTLDQADQIMGKPTGSFSDQHDWQGFQWSFDAFINSDGTIRQLDSTEDGATQATSHVACGKPVAGLADSKTRQ